MYTKIIRDNKDNVIMNAMFGNVEELIGIFKKCSYIITDEIFIHLLNIHTLNISGCRNIIDNEFKGLKGLKNLRKIIIRYRYTITKKALKNLNNYTIII